MLVGLLYAKKKHDDLSTEDAPLLMPRTDGNKNPLTDHLVYDNDNTHVDSRGSATEGVSMRVTSKDY